MAFIHNFFSFVHPHPRLFLSLSSFVITKWNCLLDLCPFIFPLCVYILNFCSFSPDILTYNDFASGREHGDLLWRSGYWEMYERNSKCRGRFHHQDVLSITFNGFIALPEITFLLAVIYFFILEVCMLLK